MADGPELTGKGFSMPGSMASKELREAMLNVMKLARVDVAAFLQGKGDEIAAGGGDLGLTTEANSAALIGRLALEMLDVTVDGKSHKFQAGCYAAGIVAGQWLGTRYCCVSCYISNLQAMMEVVSMTAEGQRVAEQASRSTDCPLEMRKPHGSA